MNATTAEKLELQAAERTVLGQKVKQLRAIGQVPAVLYGKGQENIHLQLDAEKFEQIYEEAGESTLVYLKVGSASFPTIIAEVARHPVSGAYVHADFRKVNLDEKVTAEVPVVYIGESPAVKDFSGILIKNINDVEVEALPQDLPHEIEVDISVLKQIDDHISIKDLKLNKAEIVGHEEDDLVCTVQEPRSQEELDAELAEPTSDVSAVEDLSKTEEVPAEGEEKTEEAPAEKPAE